MSRKPRNVRKKSGSSNDTLCQLIDELDHLSEKDKVQRINEIKLALHEVSPLSSEPVDCVLWVPHETIVANDYNPNAVAPPEMELLRHSINHDGYTQPIVTWASNNNEHEVIDGFHRTRVVKECEDIEERVKGYLPVVRIRGDCQERNDRIASTIRHNRARGKHQIESMSDIVIELKRRNWSNSRVCRELGMDEDEVLRLCQITGLTDVFKDQDFSQAWDVEGSVDESDFEGITDDPADYEDYEGTQTVNTNDPQRIFHTYDKWECFRAGFYATSVQGKTKEECQEEYRAFLADLDRFKKGLEGVIAEWKHSCEHYLTNIAMNRIAWLGQAAMCYSTGIPAQFRGGYNLLEEEERLAADELALEYLNRWLQDNGREPVTLEEATSGCRQSDIY